MAAFDSCTRMSQMPIFRNRALSHIIYVLVVNTFDFCNLAVSLTGKAVARILFIKLVHILSASWINITNRDGKQYNRKSRRKRNALPNKKDTTT